MSTNTPELKKSLLDAMKVSAAEIAEINKQFGVYAWRKINALNENSDLKAIVRSADDICMMAENIKKVS